MCIQVTAWPDGPLMVDENCLEKLFLVLPIAQVVLLVTRNVRGF